ncbi:lipoyl(octanoyl) transferase LipB [Microbacterium oryzae]|uniref:Octanoyltransferase n=1 Tax=Microbacterium oryzae TaxID=743009 RepID=A0A6I6DVV7_9MICO|nr:lipoyl(octanoyl) transferase LipB [Microbacterium oryzae]QGU26973.1 lipoyl(octanoyl) transferase LipB [Microbacterium oryzae]
MIDVLVAGLGPDRVPYQEGWALQRRIHAEVVAGNRPDTLILLEHDPVYTAGRRTEPHERPRDGTPVIDVDRGGKITWHGPGQLVGYPILRLPQPHAVVDHVRRLERLLIRAIGEHDVAGRRVPGRSGVWVGDGREDKVAAIGVRVTEGVSLHGFALNCDNGLDGFSQIVPCGIADAGVTTMSAETGRRVTPLDVVDAVVAAFAAEEATVAA